MPQSNGRIDTIFAADSTVTDVLGLDLRSGSGLDIESIMSEVTLTATNGAFDLLLQLDPVETFCTGDSGNAMSVPEWGTTVINLISFIGVVGGISVTILIGLLGWGIQKKSSRSTGGGGGKGWILVGLGMIAVGTLAYSVPSIAEQGYSGAEQCFAMIQPALDATLIK